MRRVLSGGQTGVDLLAMRWGLEAGLEVIGLVPRGRMNEEGQIPSEFELWELESDRYADRTRANVRFSDATLILTGQDPLSGGTRLTFDYALAVGRPVRVVRFPMLAPLEEAAATARWLAEHGVNALNIAGPRASQWWAPEGEVCAWLDELLSAVSR